MFDAQQADVLDDEIGELDAGARTPQMDAGSGVTYGEYGDGPDEGARVELSSGGPSRYFYTSKASKAERTLDGKIDNAHPTVKPID
ncbi:hypothetical protein OSG_eHP9_00010 [environmental Halophage eHP-9]|nr:hypothetical protein OSG_eHP9_00010 [environmental Halophage eHP-9]